MNVLNIPQESYYNKSIEYSKKFKMKRLRDINMYLTYINRENEIEVISRKKLYIENKQNTITRNQMVNTIKNFQCRNSIHYKLISIMVYNINVTPETLSDYIENPENFVSLFSLSRIDTFELQSTISMLKEYNAMYFFFSEVPHEPIITSLALPDSGEKGEKGEKNSDIPQKMNDHSSKSRNITKRIYIQQGKNNKRIINPHNKTKRYDKYVNLL